jgi:stearoyl-CoA desaturase (delta-9 desaturase)
MQQYTAPANADTRAKMPWDEPWWRARGAGVGVLGWIILVHATAMVGLILYPFPGAGMIVSALALAFIGGLGTTVCYHRAIAHRSLNLNPTVQTILTFAAMFNGSGQPASWASRHRFHHATADTIEDISSPVWGGFWWAHLRWLWQSGPAPVERYCREMNRASIDGWRIAQPFVVAISYGFGILISPAAFFWLGAIRLVFALHAQCLVNSICHTQPGISAGEDSSRNIWWIAPFHLLQGENWHRNHHARPGSARLGLTWRQPDLGWLTIVALERLGLATSVRRPDSRGAAAPLPPMETAA